MYEYFFTGGKGSYLSGEKGMLLVRGKGSYYHRNGEVLVRGKEKIVCQRKGVTLFIRGKWTFCLSKEKQSFCLSVANGHIVC